MRETDRPVEHVPADTSIPLMPLPTPTRERAVPPVEPAGDEPPHPGHPRPSESILRKRLRKFRRLKRGYYSFVIITGAYVASFFLPLLINNVALVVKYEGQYYFPIATFHSAVELDRKSTRLNSSH